ncbi:MAG: snoK, partial [Pseudorhodobacter sp.]|nr:snoK [Frankiaceae bacterium]
MALNTNEKLPEQNRDGGLEQDWAGNDQDWWDWYVTLAANDQTSIDLVAGPGLPDVEAASDDQLERGLGEPYALDAAAVEAFGR